MSWKFPLIAFGVAMAIITGIATMQRGSATRSGDQYETVGTGSSAFVRPKYPRQAPREDVAVSGLNWSRRDGLTYIDGDGVNTSGRTLSSVLVQIEITDKQHRRLGSLAAMFSNLRPGEQFVIHEWCTYDDAAYFRLGKITAY